MKLKLIILSVVVLVFSASQVFARSEEHTSELQSHSFISYAVFCLKKKTKIYRYSRRYDV